MNGSYSNLYCSRVVDMLQEATAYDVLPTVIRQTLGMTTNKNRTE
jgi:hypothetical protein